MTLEQIASTTGGRLDAVFDPTAQVTAPAVIDSRLVRVGGLFAALPGAHTDGHDFASQAVAAGATAVLATHPVGVPAIVVDDVTTAMGHLAQAVAARLTDTTVIGLTGSSGKTSTKDLLLQALQHHAPTVATDRSFNNEIGLPLTVLRAEPGTRYLVLEMGARHIGHIAHLTELVPPHIGLVLNIGTAHVGEFGGRDAIATAKGELIEALPSDGLAILNADDPLVAAMHTRSKAPTLTFGRHPEAAIGASDITLDRGKAHFTLITPHGTAPVALQVHGEHQISNALAAAAVAHGIGMDTSAIATALTQARPLSSGRFEVLERADGVTIINDAFNANLDSMTAGLHTLKAVADNRRTIAVLGEMRELGDQAHEAHAQVGQFAATLGIDHLITVGTTHARTIATAAHQTHPELTIDSVEDRDTAQAALENVLQPGDVVLIKASHALHLDELATDLTRS